MHISRADLLNMEQRYRATFVNSLAGFKTAVLIATKSKNEITNIGLFNSLIHLGANPALYGFIFRPGSEQRDTLSNILESGSYTLNYMPVDLYEKVHQTSATYQSGVSEFKEVGLHEEYIEHVYAPCVQEALVKIVLQFEEKIDIKINGTSLVIGSIQHIILQNDILSEDGFLDLQKQNLLGCIGLDAYFSPPTIKRLPYAKVS